MILIDRGQGAAVMVIPGIQGRWEWHAPAIEAIAARGRVVTFSLADETNTGAAFDPDAVVDSYCNQILQAMTQAGLASVALCGISYGGLIASVFAARHPERVSALILVSALPPTWRPDSRIQTYLHAPRLLTPVFMLASLRLFAEIRSASPRFSIAVVTGMRHAWNALTHMFSPTRMARRAAHVANLGLASEVALVSTPTLIIVGDAHRDRVVPVAETLTYTQLVPRALVATLEHTGHLGSITRPDAFADLLMPFVRQWATSTDSRRRLG